VGEHFIRLPGAFVQSVSLSLCARHVQNLGERISFVARRFTPQDVSPKQLVGETSRLFTPAGIVLYRLGGAPGGLDNLKFLTRIPQRRLRGFLGRELRKRSLIRRG
jgi:hypothetical protein